MRRIPAEVSPHKIFQMASEAIPAEYHDNIIIIGSLAAGYQLLRDDSEMQVRTKDIDCVLSPYYKAVLSGQSVAEGLLSAGWKHQSEGSFARPGTADTPEAMLPAIRLYPPNTKTWFLELLTEPSSTEQSSRQFERIELSTGHYGLPSFRFTGISTFNAEPTEYGIRCARPEMMALANLLENPKIKPDSVSGTVFQGREIKRSNKDLGRVLSIARLSPGEEWEKWPDAWEKACKKCFPNDWQVLAKSAGSGLKELLASESDFQEAYFTCINSILSTSGDTSEQLKITGERLLAFTIKPFGARGE